METSTKDQRVSLAANFVKNAIKGQNRLKANEQSKKRRKVYHKLHWLKVLVMLVYLSLSFFEKPSWCRDNSFWFSCKVELPNGQQVGVPWSNIPKLPQRVLHLVELVCLGFILAMVLFRHSFVQESKTSRLRKYLLLAGCLAAVADNIVVIVTQGRTYVAQFIRPLVFVLFVRSVRECCKRIYESIKEAVSIAFLLAVQVVFFGYLGLVLFKGTAEGETYFSSLEDSFWNMLVLLTTSNFPDIMLPAYAQSRWYALFFIIYLILGLFFLMNLVLAVFYNNYRSEIERIAENFVAVRSNFLENAFLILDENQKGFIDSVTLYELLDGLSQDLNIEKQQYLEVFELLDFHQNGVITREEFEQLFNVLNIVGIEKPQSPHFFMKNFPNCYREGNFFGKLRRVLESNYFEAAINIVSASNLLAELLDDMFNYYLKTWWVYLQLVYLGIYFSEMVLKILTFGPSVYFRQMLNVLDTLLNITCGVMLVVYFSQDGYNNYEYMKYLTVLRLLRVLKLIGQVKEYSIIFRTFFSLLPIFGTLLGVMTVVFYLFNLLAIEVFGGLVYPENPLIYSDPSIPFGYVHNNFNDFGSGLLTLFELLVVNNWWVTVQMLTKLTSGYWKFYFITYYFLAVLIALNLMVAFVIDTFNTQWQIEKDKKTQKKQVSSPDPVSTFRKTFTPKELISIWVQEKPNS